MYIFRETPNFDFVGNKKIALAISIFLVCASLVLFLVKGFTYGVDFRGGTIVQAKFAEQPNLPALRALLADSFESTPQITSFGDAGDNEVLVSIPIQEVAAGGGQVDIGTKVSSVISQVYSEVQIQRTETVGPKVGETLKEQAILSILSALLGILFYVWFRFRFYYGVGALLALFHDVIIILGIFILLDKEITLQIIAALLTIVGYSLNDTIVVFDRIRENVAKLPKKNLSAVVNLSVNECLSRTILTSATTLVVILSLFIFGGAIIRDFSFAIAIGLVVGTYSSVFVAGSTLIFFQDKGLMQQK